jgi:hypothetical protein
MTAAPIALQRLLLNAFALPDDQALKNWRQWRESINFEDLDPTLTRLLPIVVYGRPKWLNDDPARNIIQGLCRRAWAQQQTGSQSLAQIIGVLRREGILRVVLCGPPALGPLYAERQSIRPFESPELMIGKHEIDRAIDALSSHGWQLPQTGFNNLNCGVWLSKAGGERVYISWQRRWVCARLSNLTILDLPGTTVEMLPPEELLAEVLLAPAHGNRLAWQWDALAIAAARELDWDRVGTLTDQDERAVTRLHELRDEWGIAVPSYLLISRHGGVVTQEIRRVKRDYGWVAANDGARPSIAGFAAYCAKRWWRGFAVPRKG